MKTIFILLSLYVAYTIYANISDYVSLSKWEKENNEKHKLRRAIKRVAYKNTKMLPIFREKHPDCGKSESKYSDQYNKLIVEAMGGRGDDDEEKENKIIHNIAKQVIIEK
jgi:hypothetical protein